MLTEEEKNKMLSVLSTAVQNIRDLSFYKALDEYNDEVEDDVNGAIALVRKVFNPQWVEYGCTKIVFQLTQFPDYVFKIPFMGTKRYYWDDEEYYSSEEDETEFTGANLAGTVYDGWDYCYIEACVYEEALAEHVAEAFAGTWFLGDIKGWPFYCSECVDGISTYGYQFKNYQDSVNASNKIKMHSTNSSLHYYLPHVVDAYGVEKAKAINDFVEEWEITDLHSGNVWCDKEGKIRIIDYAGYNEGW